MGDLRMTPESYAEMLEVPVEEWNEFEFELVESLKAEREFAERKCRWYPDHLGSRYLKPSCTSIQGWVDFNDTEDPWKFCPYCGGEIEEKKENDNRIRPS